MQVFTCISQRAFRSHECSSAEAFRPSVDLVGEVRAQLRAAVEADAAGDEAQAMLSILVSGALNQQLANEPGARYEDGRFTRLVPQAIDLFIRHYAPRRPTWSTHSPSLLGALPRRRFSPEEPLPDPTLGHLVDVLSNRDTWMHRLEIARATGRPFVVSGHDPAAAATSHAVQGKGGYAATSTQARFCADSSTASTSLAARSPSVRVGSPSGS